jgi:predicted nucleic acid-binding protein
MNAVVVDTSVIVKWLNQDNEEYVDQADDILRDVQAAKIQLIVPELAKYEVGNLLIHGKGLTYEQAITVLAQLYKLPLTFVEDNELLAVETVAIAANANVTYYDASFIAVAKQFDAVLITDNVKHQGRARDVKVIAIKDY